MRGAGLDGVLHLLACPHCAEPLTRSGGTVGCPAGHRFDIARQGYLSLLGNRSRTDTGDSAEMVAARMAFLGSGHYRPIADAIADVVTAGTVLEIGAGTGYYLGAVLDRLAARGVANPCGVALDASRYAARRAAADRRVGSIVADAWSRLPVRDAACGAVLSVFAPRDPAEIARVLAPGGSLVVVTPEPAHLAEIRDPLGLLTVDAGKPERLADSFAGLLTPVDRCILHRGLALTREDVVALVLMGPAARHLTAEQVRAAAAELAELTAVTLAVTVNVLQTG